MCEAWKDLEGQVIDAEFRLIQLIGGSEASGVFLTQLSDPSLRAAAIKIVRAPTDAEAQLARWQQAASLSHPHVMRIFAVGNCQANGIALQYVVMEYAEENLAQILPQRPLTPSEAQEMLREVTDALVYLHAGGFVHRRLNPSNIMAVADQVKVASETVCRTIEHCTQEKSDFYSPPEGGISPAGDVWSLGVTLVESLTLRRPVWDSSTQHEPVLPEGMTSPFLEIARRCLQVNPNRRATAADIAARLERSRSSADTAVSRATKSSPRMWMYVGIVATVTVLFIVLGINFSSKAKRQPSPENAATTPVEPPAQPGVKPATPAPPPRASRPSELDLKAAAPEKPSPATGRSAPATLPPGGIVPGSVARRVMPEPSRSARNTIQGHVRVSVKVTVDDSGNVVNTSLESSGPSRYFARLASDAARKWKFAPAQVDGRKVASEWILRFSFGREGTEVTPAQALP